MKRLIGLLILNYGLFAGVLLAQTAPRAPQATGINIVFKDGRNVTATTLRRSAENVMATVQIGAGMGEIGYPAVSIAQIDFPEPPQLRAAASLLAQGKAGDALAPLDAVVTYYEPFKNIAGNWWVQAARLKLKVLVALHRDDDAEGFADVIAKGTSDPADARMAKVLHAEGLARKGNHEKAIAGYDEVIAQGGSADLLARAWLSKGLSLLAMKEYDSALLACLRLPVFYPDEKSLMPQALLASARAYVGVDDQADAEKTLKDLIEQFPSSPETAGAKAQLEKLTRPAQDKP